MEGMENKGGTCVGHCKCGCNCHKIVPGLVVLYGLIVIASMMGWLGMSGNAIVNWALPIFLLIGGLKAMFSNKCQCC